MAAGRRLPKAKSGIALMTVKEVRPYLSVYSPFEVVRNGGIATRKVEPSRAADSEPEWWVTAAVSGRGN